MKIGDYYYYISENWIVKIIIKLLGTIDLHSHIRLKPVINFLQHYLSKKSRKSIKILELGCGTGVCAFELNKISQKGKFNFDYTGIDVSSNLISISQKILKSVNVYNNRIKFICDDAINYLTTNNNFKVDIILLVDIIEHINEPERLLNLSNNLLNKDGIILVSVPTPLYPKYFGAKFHKEMGHLVDGYSLNSIVEMFNDINCVMIFYNYNTGFIGKYGCYLYYKIFNTRKRVLQIIKWLLLMPFKYLDLINNSKISCSLFAVFRKTHI